MESTAKASIHQANNPSRNVIPLNDISQNIRYYYILSWYICLRNGRPVSTDHYVYV